MAGDALSRAVPAERRGARRVVSRAFAGLLRRDFEKCGAHPSVKCLTPYAPNTMARGGTFYASVHDYAAELAVRYFKDRAKCSSAGRCRKGLQMRAARECAWRSLL